MTGDPKRLLEQPHLPEAQRQALAHGSAPVPYDVGAGLSRFRAALGDTGGFDGGGDDGSGGGPSAGGGGAATTAAGVTGWKAAFAVACVLAVAALGFRAAVGLPPEPPVSSANTEDPSVSDEPIQPDTAAAHAGDGAAVAMDGDVAAVAADGASPGPLAARVDAATPRTPRATPGPRRDGRQPAEHRQHSLRAHPPTPRRAPALQADFDASPAARTSSAVAVEANSAVIPQASAAASARDSKASVATAAPAAQPTPRAKPRPSSPVAPRSAAEPQPRPTAVRPVAAAAPEPQPRPEASSQVDELRAIARARLLLRRDPAAALVALRALRRDFPRGYFVEERRALTVLALHRSGDHERSEPAARAFLRDYPRSPFVDRVRAVIPD